MDNYAATLLFVVLKCKINQGIMYQGHAIVYVHKNQEQRYRQSYKGLPAHK